MPHPSSSENCDWLIFDRIWLSINWIQSLYVYVWWMLGVNLCCVCSCNLKKKLYWNYPIWIFFYFIVCFCLCIKKAKKFNDSAIFLSKYFVMNEHPLEQINISNFALNKQYRNSLFLVNNLEYRNIFVAMNMHADRSIIFEFYYLINFQVFF